MFPVSAIKKNLIEPESEEEMWFKLALALGGRTVAEWKEAMSLNEFSKWCAFYRYHPFDDFHRYHRPAALIATHGGNQMQAALDWLSPPQMQEGIDSIGLSVMRALGVKPRGN